MPQLPKEDTCIIHRTKKAKTCSLKVTNEKCLPMLVMVVSIIENKTYFYFISLSYMGWLVGDKA